MLVHAVCVLRRSGVTTGGAILENGMLTAEANLIRQKEIGFSLGFDLLRPREDCFPQSSGVVDGLVSRRVAVDSKCLETLR